jgi:hypothetical protein
MVKFGILLAGSSIAGGGASDRGRVAILSCDCPDTAILPVVVAARVHMMRRIR